ncbi:MULTISPECIES: glycosyltransferase [Paenibacillus]|uniref:GAP1-N2 domain-containing protein n=1 Tax=Paenibacillus TaxID=44249 RepID=UPI0020416FBE|nr:MULTISPECIES: glycosyltransferase [Paenibacillus]
MIQQQLYTRERSGIFRGTEGFDTVAVSDGLDAVFIKKQLHPFCGYDAPAELASRGEKEVSSYPPAIHLFHTEGGETVLGRSIYQPVDFTGLRSAFLTHNYVIPSARLDEIVTHYVNYLNADYAEKYYTEIGRELPELDDIPQKSQKQQQAKNSPISLTAEKLLKEIKLDEKSFKQLLFAVMTAVGEGRKKVYVALDVPAEQISQYSVALLKVLFACLPFELRRRFGFITYAKEPQSRKFIHLQFVERGSLRPNDREIEKEYVFDLASGRLPQDEVDEGKQPYLDFVWNAIGELGVLENFHRFADEMLSGMDPQRRALLSSYHELCVFFQIESERWDLYEKHKITVLRGLLSYLEPHGALDSRIRLNDIFLAAFDREFDSIKQGSIVELAIVECFRDYYRLESRSYGPKLVNYLIHAVNNSLTEGRTELAYSLYALIESQSELSKAFFGTVLKLGELSNRLFNPYIQNKLVETQGSKEVLNVVHSWAIAHPGLLQSASFKEIAVAGLTDKLSKEQRLLSSVHMTVDSIRKWARTPLPDSGMTVADSELAELLSLSAKRLLLDELELDKLTQDQVTTAAFLGGADAFAGLQLDSKQRSHAEMLRTLYEWFAQREPTEDVFRLLSSEELDRIQKLGRKWLQSSIEVEQFGKIVLAFCQDSAVGIIDYNQVIDYLQRHAKDKEKIYEFMLWSQGNSYFVHARGLAPGYSAAILAYFKKHDKDAFKSRDYRTRYFDKAGAPLAKVLADARLTLSSPLKRFLVQNGKKVRMTTLIVALGLVVAVGVLFILQQQGMLGAKAPVEATPPATQDSGVLVYAENVKGSDGTETTSLVFLFKGEEQCKVFDPSNLMIESQGQSAQQFKNLKYDCVVADAGTEDSEATDPSGEVDGTDGKDETEGIDGTTKDTEGIDKAKGNNTGSNTGENGAASGKETGKEDKPQSGSQNTKTGGADGVNAANSTHSTDGTSGTNGTKTADGTNVTNSTNGTKATKGTKGTNGTNGTNATNETNGTNSPDAGKSNVTDPTDASNPNGLDDAPKPGETAGTDDGETKDSSYTFRIVVSLGMKLEIPAGSVIKLGEQQYTVITREEAESGSNLVNP